MNKKFHQQLDDHIEKNDFQSESNDLSHEEKELLKSAELINKSKAKGIPNSQDFQNKLLSQIKQKRKETVKEVSEEPKVQVGLWNNLFNIWQTKKWIPAMGGIVLVALIASLFYWLPGSNTGNQIIVPKALAEESFDLKPTSMDSIGIDTESDFSLTAKVDVSLDQVEDNLTITPEVNYTIKQKSDRDFLIDIKDDLAPNQIYKLGLMTNTEKGESKELSWAYQVKDDFKVLSSIPDYSKDDKSIGVPADTAIEITFSHANFVGWEDHWQITPETNGYFEKYNNTLVFVPDSLKFNTYYKVTIDKDFGLEGSSQTLGEDFVLDFVVGDSSSGSMSDKYWYFEEEINYFSPDEAPVLPVNVYDQGSEELHEVAVDVYKLESESKFLEVIDWYNKIPDWATKARRNNLYSTDNLDRVQKFTAPVEELNFHEYFAFPDKLEVGFYLVEGFKYQQKYQTLVQITNLDSYVSITRTDSMVWVSDLSNPNEEIAAIVEILNTDNKYTSNGEGVVVFATPSIILENDDYSFYLKISANDSVLYLPMTQNRQHYYRECEEAEQYWRHIYLDREVYRPSDTLNFWGAIKPRSQNQPAIENLQMRISKSINGDVYQNLDVTVSQDGFFEGEVFLEKYTPGSYYFELYSQEKPYIATTFSVEDYIKPSYKIDVKPLKRVLLPDEEIKFDVETVGFENTPVPYVEVEYSHEYLGKESYLTTDANGRGEAVINYSPKFYCHEQDYLYGCYDTTLSAYFQTSRAEEGQIVKNSQVTIVPSKINVEVNSEYTGGQQVKFVANTNWIDFDKCNDAEEYCLDYNGEAATNQPITVKLYKDYWIKQEVGKYYDFINKRTVPEYEYENVKELIEEFDATTNDEGKYEYILENFDQRVGYRLLLEVADAEGRVDNDSSYFSGYYYDWFNSKDGEYLIINKTKSEDEEWQQYYNLDEQIDLEIVRYDEADLAGSNNKYLFTKLQGGLKDYQITDNQQYSFEFSQEDVPNVYINAIVFDGQKFSQATFADGMNDFRFNYEQKDIEFDVKTDKEQYRPGEKATIEITTRDVDGQPIPVTTNISLVDEAYYELFDTRRLEDIARDWYQPIQAGILAEHVRGYGFMEWEKQAGGAGGVRDDFVDVALFTSLKTNSNGQGQVVFDLPDNITSWRVNVQGIGDDNHVGFNESNFNVTQEVLVDYVLNDTYLKDDRPVIQIRSYGRSLTAEDKIDINIQSESLNINQDLSASAWETVDWALPELTVGEHDLVVSANNGQYEDTVKKTFKVVDSYYTQPVFEYYDLSEDIQLAGDDDSRVDLKFYNKNAGEYYYQLNLQYLYADRIDQIVSKYLATNLLNDYFAEDNFVENIDILNYQNEEDGGLSLLPYSSSDLEISARLSGALQDDWTNKNLLINYFNAIATSKDSNTAEVVQALYGLASLNQPVLTPINYWVSQSDVSTVDRLYLALAAERLGAKQMAKNSLNEILDSVGQESEQYIYLDMGNEVDNIKFTALATVLAGRVDHGYKHKMWNYINTQYNQDAYIIWDKIEYIEAVLSGNDIDDIAGSFSYSFNDKSEKISLEKGSDFALSLTSDELSVIKFSDITGDIALILEKEVGGHEETLTNDSNLNIRREYYVDGVSTKEFKEGEIIEVRIYPDISTDGLDGMYEIKDILPSGLKPLTRTYSHDQYYPYDYYQCQIYFPYDIVGQKVNLLIGKDWQNTWCNIDYISYFARVSNKGDYRIEPIMMIYSDDPGTKVVNQENGEIMIY